jgi:hypothetical protein
MNTHVRQFLSVLVGIALIAVAGFALMAAHRADHPAPPSQETVAPTRSAAQSAEGTLTLNVATQAHEGIQVQRLKQTSMRSESHGTAVVLSVADLANARTSYFMAARTKLERDRMNVNVMQSQYQRVKTLYEENQNMSLKAMEDAQTAYRDSQAQLATDQQDARLELDVVRQKWGAAVTNWLANDSPVLDSVLAQREFLLQVTFSSADVTKPEATLSLVLPNQKIAMARFISALPQVNPQIQNASFLYLATARPGMAVGMNLEALIPAGKLQRGSVVPESAVVWWQGAAWVYQKISSDRFARRAVPTATPISGGYFVPGNTLSPGTNLVTTGASTLLSQELLAHPRGEAGGEEDSDDD